MDVLSEDEVVPAYPAAPSGLTPAAAALDPAALWRRLETWTTRRWPARNVTWIVCGAGAFVPRLAPAVLVTAEQWDGNTWSAITPAAAPFGLVLELGTYRLTYTVGDNADIPASVAEAYRRLAEFSAQVQGNAGLTSVKDGDYSATFSASAAAKALQLSGAADLLRPYR